MSISKPLSIADWASILTLPVLGTLMGSLAFYGNSKMNEAEAHSDAAVATLKQEMTAQYETQVAHAADVSPIKEDTQKLWEGEKQLVDGENEIKVSLQKVADAVDNGNQQRNK